MREGHLAAQLVRAGIEKRFAIDIGSVVAGIRSMGLLHCELEKVKAVEQILNDYQLKKLAGRKLFRLHDEASRESVLSTTKVEKSDDWFEIWYGNQTLKSPSPEELFSETGRFLGYPECCQQAMRGEGCLAALYRRYFHEDRHRNWRLNRLAALFHPTILMPDFFPCSLSCTEATRFVTPIQTVSPEFLGQEDMIAATVAMKAPLTVIGEEIFSWRTWSIADGCLEVLAADSLKETIRKVAHSLSGTDGSYALLLDFEHFYGSGLCRSPSVLRIRGNKQEFNDITLRAE
jgi:hypothetical protein